MVIKNSKLKWSIENSTLIRIVTHPALDYSHHSWNMEKWKSDSDAYLNPYKNPELGYTILLFIPYLLSYVS